MKWENNVRTHGRVADIEDSPLPFKARSRQAETSSASVRHVFYYFFQSTHGYNTRELLDGKVTLCPTPGSSSREAEPHACRPNNAKCT